MTPGRYWLSVFQRAMDYLSSGVSHALTPPAVVLSAPTREVYEAVEAAGSVTPGLRSQCVERPQSLSRCLAVCTVTRPSETCFLNGLTNKGAEGVAAIFDAMARWCLRAHDGQRSFGYEDYVVLALTPEQFARCVAELAPPPPRLNDFFREQDMVQSEACMFFGHWDYPLYGWWDHIHPDDVRSILTWNEEEEDDPRMEYMPVPQH